MPIFIGDGVGTDEASMEAGLAGASCPKRLSRLQEERKTAAEKVEALRRSMRDIAKTLGVNLVDPQAVAKSSPVAAVQRQVDEEEANLAGIRAEIKEEKPLQRRLTEAKSKLRQLDSKLQASRARLEEKAEVARVACASADAEEQTVLDQEGKTLAAQQDVDSLVAQMKIEADLAAPEQSAAPGVTPVGAAQLVAALEAELQEARRSQEEVRNLMGNLATFMAVDAAKHPPHIGPLLQRACELGGVPRGAAPAASGAAPPAPGAPPAGQQTAPPGQEQVPNASPGAAGTSEKAAGMPGEGGTKARRTARSHSPARASASAGANARAAVAAASRAVGAAAKAPGAPPTVNGA